MEDLDSNRINIWQLNSIDAEQHPWSRDGNSAEKPTGTTWKLHGQIFHSAFVIKVSAGAWQPQVLPN